MNSVSLGDKSLPLRDHPEALSVLQTLQLFAESECSDPRDRVYALKDLTVRGASIPVDYNQDVRGTYIALVKSVIFNMAVQFELPDIHKAESNQLKGINMNESIRMLVLASCKKASRSEGFAMEAWVPDWRIENHFESRVHEETVDWCMQTSPFDGHLSSPMRLAEASNGYLYLGLKGDLFQRSLSDVGLTGSRRETWLKRLGKHFGPHWPAPALESDRIWLTSVEMVQRKSDTSFILDKWLVFMLRGTEAKSPYYNDRPVYRLHSCFTISKAYIEPYFSALQGDADAIRKSMATRISFGQEFYLE